MEKETTPIPLPLPRAVVQQARDTLNLIDKDIEWREPSATRKLVAKTIAALDEALAQPAPTLELPQMPERPEPDGSLTIQIAGHAVEVNAYRDSTMEEFAKAYARAALAQHTAEVRSLREENERLRGECVEWLCARCQTIHPSQRGRTFLQPCPECGDAMEPTSFNIRARRRMDDLIDAARMGLELLISASNYIDKLGGDSRSYRTCIAALSAAIANHPKEGGQQG